ncbi:hypothetical protein HJ526_13260 [Donghicola sp. C2-DW-16]|uniref:Flp family type IVb pilin n=1 Tax=Donghicola mangrovi TaxID=2729614 RepID=A0ABX2PH16_9RHOB|nr:hypothetical protein [Donghicola mangrovi]NVO28396.1 hypothetical protein [Donghicola mangrovi]
MLQHTAFSFAKFFAECEDGASSVEWVVIVTMLAGFAYGTGLLMADNTTVLIGGISDYVGSLDAPS